MSTALTSCFLGCGPRARRHAEAYPHVSSLTPVAAADLDAERATTFARDFGIPHTFTDYREMLRVHRPAVVHCVTQPDFRAEPVRVCAEHGVQAVIIEKPMATSLAAAAEIEEVAESTGIKVIVNTQRRYFASWISACQVIREQLGNVRFIHIHTNPALGCIGSHVLDMAQALLGDPAPESVWATAAGAEDWHTNHPGPTQVLASIDYPGRVNLKLEMSKVGIGVPGCNFFWMSTGIEVVCDGGFLWWTEDRGWGYQRHGEAEAHRFPTNFVTDDIPGQGAFTEAIGQWLLGGEPHGNRLETAIRVYRIVGAIIQSSARGGRLPYADDTVIDCMDELRDKLVAIEGDHPEHVDWATCRDVKTGTWL